MYNSITAAAYLVKDPEVRTISSGKKVATLRVGISPSNAKTKCFVDVEYWDKTAELAEKYLTKGREFVVQGELCMSSWEKDGKNFSKYFIRGKDMQFLSSKKVEGKSEEKTEDGVTSEATDDIPF
jgi:single-strand DNA-binding protein|tara:strand:+ start:173 stop:547 length:375 start_codon:yes stop_codon:yes gene_type:complete